MPLTLSAESKNNLVLTNQDKGSDNMTWDQALFTWDQAGTSTWDVVKTFLTPESKNSLSLSNEAKN